MINKDDEEFYEKYGIASGAQWLAGINEKVFIQTTHNLNDDTRWIVFMNDKFDVIDDIQQHGLVSKEKVKEYKTKGDSGVGWEETTQHKVWLLQENGMRKCPWCGAVPGSYTHYNDARYIGDHRAGQCSECKRFAFVTHDHIDGVCQPIVNLENFNKV